MHCDFSFLWTEAELIRPLLHYSSTFCGSINENNVTKEKLGLACNSTRFYQFSSHPTLSRSRTDLSSMLLDLIVYHIALPVSVGIGDILPLTVR